jgi:regulator of sigma E protease
VHFELMAALELPSPGLLWSIFQMVIGIGLIIFVHEMGHFLAAKACGVKCEKFYVGFDAFDINLGVFKIPRRLAYFQWGETEYGIGILPLGGYVKMLGQNDNPVESVTDPGAAQAAIKMVNDGPRIDAQADAPPEIDPRSFQAKSVPQRMLIMSAGVIMNLIFAVIFAAFAFGFGVSHQPAMVGDSVAGSPAWENNLSGVQVLEVNGTRTLDRYYPFGDLAETIMVGGADQEVVLEIKRSAEQSQTERLSVKPVVGLVKMKGFNPPTLGIGPMQSCRIGTDNPTLPGEPAHEAGFLAEDLIVKINGQPVNNRVEMSRELFKAWDQPVVFTVLRGTEQVYFSYRDYERAGVDDGELVDLTVATNPLREIGFTPKIGPVAAVQLDSPAYQQGIKAGDEILTLDGQVFDPFTSPQYLRQMARAQKPVAVGIRRNGAEQDAVETINIVPQFPSGVNRTVEEMPFAVDELGVAMLVYNQVASLDSDLTTTQPGIQVNDEIVSLEFDFSDSAKREEYLEKYGRQTRVSGPELATSFGMIFEQLQSLPESVFVKLRVKREGREMDVVLTPKTSERYFSEKRGMMLQPLMEVYQADDAADALYCGWRPLQHDSGKIFKILRQMVVGNVPMTALGGIGSISVVATSEAMSGTTRLLMFLTMLSVNLAIINFLPIPVLDGGHMVFLAYEGVTGQPPNERIQEGLTMIGGLLLLGLIIFALGMDVWRIAGMFT